MRPIIRRLLEQAAGFSPRQLFASMIGAWYEPSVSNGTCFTDTAGTTPATAESAVARINDLSGYGNNASQSTAANRPILKVSGNQSYLRYDSTDVLVSSLPAINVRRNLLTYSEQFDNAAWTKTNCTIGSAVPSPIAGNAYAIIDNATNGAHRPVQLVADSSTAIHTFSFYAKSGICRYVRTAFAALGDTYFDLQTGIVSTLGANTTATITPTVLPGWYRCTISGAGSPAPSSHFASPQTSGNPQTAYIGTGEVNMYFAGMQLELGSVATPYQKITDWTSEAYSSSGSVYFATPVGMSSLHNQSMGTTYTLPALSSDIYSWIVVPQRLSAVQESRLALYMQQKAGIAGPEYLLDSADGQLTADDGLEILLAQ